jgi:hypothetical protein
MKKALPGTQVVPAAAGVHDGYSAAMTVTQAQVVPQRGRGHKSRTPRESPTSGDVEASHALGQ